MKVYTCQISKHRKVAELGIPFKDITVKSGDKVFAPTWEILMEYKNGGGEDLYTSKFIPLMRQSYQQNKSVWLELCEMDEVCLACYCKSGAFCHRHIIVDMLEKVCQSNGIEFERGGEIT